MHAAGRVVDIGELQLRVFESRQKGRSTRPVFVIVHGIGSSHRYGVRLQNELARTGEALAVDLPGFGGMAHPAHPLSIEAYAALVGRLLDALDIPVAVLVGHSMGAQIVTELAVERPSLVSHLVLVGPVVDPERDTAVQQALDLARDSLWEPLYVKRIAAADTARAGLRWFAREVGPMLVYPLAERLARVGVPVLIVRGADDPIARLRWCAALAGSAPGARLVEVRGHRHVVHLTAPRSVAGSIRTLLRPPAVPSVLPPAVAPGVAPAVPSVPPRAVGGGRMP